MLSPNQPPTPNESSSSTPQSTPDESVLSKFTSEIAERLKREHNSSGEKTYVLYSRLNNSIVFDPRTQKPVASTNPKVLETFARRIKAVNRRDDAVVVTVAEATRLFFKNSKKS